MRPTVADLHKPASLPAKPVPPADPLAMGSGDATMMAGLVEYKDRRESAWEKQCHCNISTLTVKEHNDISFEITVSIKHNSHIKGIRYFILN